MDQLPTHEDANLILRLYELRREPKMREARAWFVANFYPESLDEMTALCPPGSEANAYMRMVASYWEMAASFVAGGVLNEELFFQSGMELLLTYMRVKPILGELRKANQSPLAWRNLEAVGEKFIAHLNANAPGTFEGFQARMGKRHAAKKPD